MYINFIALLCKLTVDFMNMWRYNKNTIRQERKAIQGGNKNENQILYC